MNLIITNGIKINTLKDRWSLLDITWLIFLAVSYVFSSSFRITTMGTVIILCFTTFINILGKWRLGYKSFIMCVLWYSAFSLWIIYSFFTGEYISNSASSIVDSVLLNILILICLLYYLISERRIERFLNIIVYSTTFFAVMYLITSPIDSYGTTSMGGITGVWRTAAGYYTCYAGVIALFIYSSLNKKKTMLLCTIVCMGCAVFTGSRKVLIQIAITIFLYIILQDNVKKKIKTLAIVIFIGMILLVIASQIPFFQEFYGERFLAIFDENIVDSSVAGRNYLKDTAIQLFIQRPIGGNGVDAVRYYLELIGYRWATYSHNNYVEILSSYGIIGILLYYYYIIKTVIKGYRYKKYSKNIKLFIILLITYLIMDIGSVSYYMRMYFITVSVPLLGIEYYVNTKYDGRLKNEEK